MNNLLLKDNWNGWFLMPIQFTDQQLHVVYLEPAPREKCEEESEVSPHTICTQEKSTYDGEEQHCNVWVISRDPSVHPIAFYLSLFYRVKNLQDPHWCVKQLVSGIWWACQLGGKAVHQWVKGQGYMIKCPLIVTGPKRPSGSWIQRTRPLLQPEENGNILIKKAEDLKSTNSHKERII